MTVTTEIRVGSVLTIIDPTLGDGVLALVNGTPVVYGVTEKGKFTLLVRVPCHIPETNTNMDVAGPNIVKEGWP